jgi:hypothetical protein
LILRRRSGPPSSFAHKLREALAAETADLRFNNTVEVEGAYFGGHIRQANREGGEYVPVPNIIGGDNAAREDAFSCKGTVGLQAQRPSQRPTGALA